MIKLLTPDMFYQSIFDIELDALVTQGLEGIIIDLDNTIIERDKNIVPEKLTRWFEEIKAKGFQLCVVSNNTAARCRDISKRIDRTVIAMAKKPSRSAFIKALDVIKVPAEKTVVIGDQLFTDIYGGKRMGLKTILVQPLEGKDFWLTKLLVRRIEGLVLKRIKLDTALSSSLKREGQVEVK